MNDIVIVGAGGLGREVAWLIERINKIENRWNLLGFVDDNKECCGKNINGYEVLGNLDWLKKQSLNVVIAIGDTKVKKDIVKKLDDGKNKFPTLIDPSVISSEYVEIGEGSIICAGSIITVDVQIGKHTIINLDCTIGHDVKIGNYNTILPSVNISGNINTEEGVNVGTGSAIIQGVSIGKNVTIGAGSVVIKNIPDDCVAVGSPAKPIKYT